MPMLARRNEANGYYKRSFRGRAASRTWAAPWGRTTWVTVPLVRRSDAIAVGTLQPVRETNGNKREFLVAIVQRITHWRQPKSLYSQFLLQTHFKDGLWVQHSGRPEIPIPFFQTADNSRNRRLLCSEVDNGSRPECSNGGATAQLADIFNRHFALRSNVQPDDTA
jgi:hypothetical protein